MAGAGILLVAACSDGSNGGTGSPASTPMTISEYGTAAADAFKPLNAALRELDEAGPSIGLNGKVNAVRDAVSQTTVALAAARPPAGIGTEHSRVLGALRRFHGEASTAGTEVGGRRLCTGPAVWTALGKAEGTAQLRDSTTALFAGLSGQRFTLGLPGAEVALPSRPPNGRLIRSYDLGGRASLSIDNGGPRDAVVTLRQGDTTTLSVYVHTGREFTATGIKDGTYTVYFTGGNDWDRETRAFGSDCTFQRFDDPLRYRTTRTDTEIRWTTWKINLEPVPGAEARTTQVTPDEFPG